MATGGQSEAGLVTQPGRGDVEAVEITLDHQRSSHSGVVHSFDHRVAIMVESRIAQMAVGVDGFGGVGHTDCGDFRVAELVVFLAVGLAP